ncbi:hypothetical protein [Chelativorans alearense]|uniref:hypothetical protein n=1 Tax=Chelativorans alearense TaxID=2681495 RepID=UPI0013D8072C|nr:hypothetical protein [Chelativorans alearense]
MTAFIAAAYEDRIELLTDGATVRDDGTIAILETKGWRSPTVPLAFAGRGNVGALMHIGAILLKLSDCASVNETLEAFTDELADRLPRLRGAEIDGVVCAISETAGPLIFYFTTSDTVPGAEPFVLYETMPIHGAGSEPPADALAACGFPGRLAAEPLSACGVDLFEIMRRHKMRHLSAGGHLVYGIGGHVDLTTVTADGCTTTRLHEWPEDVVGATIRPSLVTHDDGSTFDDGSGYE